MENRNGGHMLSQKISSTRSNQSWCRGVYDRFGKFKSLAKATSAMSRMWKEKAPRIIMLSTVATSWIPTPNSRHRSMSNHPVIQNYFRDNAHSLQYAYVILYRLYYSVILPQTWQSCNSDMLWNSQNWTSLIKCHHVSCAGPTLLKPWLAFHWVGREVIFAGVCLFMWFLNWLTADY